MFSFKKRPDDIVFLILYWGTYLYPAKKYLQHFANCFHLLDYSTTREKRPRVL